MAYTVSQFATAVRNKTGAYQDWDDLALARAVITKYPVYASQVSLPTPGAFEVAEPTVATATLGGREPRPETIFTPAQPSGPVGGAVDLLGRAVTGLPAALGAGIRTGGGIVGTGIRQLLRPSAAVANVARGLMELRRPEPGEPGKTLPEVLREKFLQPAVRGFTLQEPATPMDVVRSLVRRGRTAVGIPPTAPIPLAAKGAEFLGGFGATLADPTALGIFKALGLGTRAVAQLPAVQRAVEAGMAKVPGFFKYGGGAPGAFLQGRESAQVAEQEEQRAATELLKTSFESGGITVPERLRVSQLVKGAEPSPTEADLVARANPVRGMLDSLAQQTITDVVRGGFVPERVRDSLARTLETNLGKYTPQLYRIFEAPMAMAKAPGTSLDYLIQMTPDQLKAFESLDPEGATRVLDLIQKASARAAQGGGFSRAGRLAHEMFTGRKDLSADFRAALREETDLAYPIGKRTNQLIHNLFSARFISWVDRHPDWVSEVDRPGFIQMPENVRQYGPLAGKYVLAPIQKELTYVNELPGRGMQAFLAVLNQWKPFKTIWQLNTHSRNLMGNIMLLDQSGMDLASIPGYLARSGRQLIRGEKDYLEARRAGLFGHEFWGNEIRKLLPQVEAAEDAHGLLAAALRPFAITQDSLGRLYQAEEQWFKMAKYLHVRDAGGSVAEAVAEAEKWEFNYSKVSRFIQLTRQVPFGSPFVTFTAKAVPRTLETMIFEPYRLAKYQMAFDALEREAQRRFGLSDGQLRRLKSAQRGYAIVLPIRGPQGRPLVFNLSYILPWGNMLEHGAFFGLPGVLSPGGPGQIALETATGLDLYRHSLGLSPAIGAPGASTREQIQARINHLYRGIFPNLAPGVPGVTGPAITAPSRAGQPPRSLVQRFLEAQATHGGFAASKLAAAFSGLPDFRGRERPLLLAALDSFLGIKLDPVNLQDVSDQEVIEFKRQLNTIKMEMRRVARSQAVPQAQKDRLLGEATQRVRTLVTEFTAARSAR